MYPVQPNPEWQVSLLGPFRLEAFGHTISTEGWKSKKALTLLKILLAKQGDSVSRESLLELLWPDEPEERALRCLHTTVYFLRQALQPYCGATDGVEIIRQNSGRYQFRPPQGCWYDIKQFESLFQRGVGAENEDASHALRLYLQAIDLYRDDFLIEAEYEEWTTIPRAYYLEIYIQCILKAVSLLVRANDTMAAIRLCRLGLRREPYREDVHEAYLKCLIAGGRHGEAMQHFREYRSMINTEYDVEPTLDIDSLVREARPRVSATRQQGSDQPPTGPFVCERKTFEAILSLEARRQRRTGEPLALFKLVLPPTVPPRSQTHLLSVISGQLRRDDVLCWSDAGNVLVQLHRTDSTTAERVRRRLEQALSQAAIPFEAIRYAVVDGSTAEKQDPLLDFGTTAFG